MDGNGTKVSKNTQLSLPEWGDLPTGHDKLVGLRTVLYPKAGLCSAPNSGWRSHGLELVVALVSWSGHPLSLLSDMWDCQSCRAPRPRERAGARTDADVDGRQPDPGALEHLSDTRGGTPGGADRASRGKVVNALLAARDPGAASDCRREASDWSQYAIRRPGE